MRTIFLCCFRPVSEESIRLCCQHLSLTQNPTSPKHGFKEAMKDKVVSLDNNFDVFISYSHKNVDVASSIYNHIKRAKPHWEIFFDQDSLKVGFAWQSKLYSSIGKISIFFFIKCYSSVTFLSIFFLFLHLVVLSGNHGNHCFYFFFTTFIYLHTKVSSISLS